jgi:putative YphP/YqiW family bacilliredoxin
VDVDPLLDPMRAELTDAGIEELGTADEVDRALRRPGTALVAVNSSCGCSAARMRPALCHALRSARVLPDHLYSVFAGQDLEATARAREYFTGIAPCSPAIALLRDGQLVWMMQRRHLENRELEVLVAELEQAFEDLRSGQLARRAG